jgi:hypothetical protein
MGQIKPLTFFGNTTMKRASFGGYGLADRIRVTADKGHKSEFEQEG